VTGKGEKEKGGKNHSIGGNDEGRGFAELNKNRSRRDSDHSDGKENKKGDHHGVNLISIGPTLQAF
jgi:hypothetical protein